MPAQDYPVALIGTTQVIHVPVSFESNETGQVKLLLPFRCRVTNVISYVTKTVAGSNNGTITLKAGSTALATVTVAASAAITDQDVAESITEHEFEVGDEIILETAKSTAGGKCLVNLAVLVLPTHAS